MLEEKEYMHLGYNNPKKLSNILYENCFGKAINWNSPTNLNEKINWLAFNTDTSIWSTLADKYKVRNYIKQKGFEHILTQIYGVWDNVDFIDFNKLPNKFVLKCNHDAGTAIFIKDKTKLNIDELKLRLKENLNSPFGVKTAEPHYLGIKRLIFAEEFLEERNSLSNSLIDYKFWSFNGITDYCHVIYNKQIYKEKKSDVYAVKNWKRLNGKLINVHESLNLLLPKPSRLKEMIEIIYQLTNEFPECRVDLYECNNKVYFGELTFTSACGRIKNYSEDFLLELGNSITLPSI